MTNYQLEHELIRASAGTGKTYELTNRYVHLLQMGQRPEEILASTFTRKAAGEILGRVLLRLAQAATDASKLAELQTALKDESLDRGQCLAMLVRTARQLHRLRVGTLDSFFAQLASSFALELGLPPGWRIAEEHEDAALRERATEAVLDNEDAGSLLTLVHALTRGETTRSLDREVREKVNTLYTVYRESNREAWHRLPRKPELSGPQLAEAVETLRRIPLPTHKSWEKNHSKAVEAATTEDWAGFIKAGIAAKIAEGADSYYRKPIEPAIVAAYQPLIDHAKAVLLNQLANQTEATYQLLDKFHNQYQQLKMQGRALRFDDVTFQLAERSLTGPPETVQAEDETSTSDHLAFRLDAHLNHLLLDEFQDTSLAQWSVIRPFAKRIARGNSSPGGSFFCVGDTKQAIYGWRGGVAEIFDEVARELQPIHQRPLDTSWRSSPHVIAAVNRIFENLHRHANLGDLADAVTGWQSQFNEHHTAKPKQGLNGHVRLQAARTATDSETDPQKDITLRYAAEQVAMWKRKAPGFEIGVLVRRNDAVRRLIFELRELGIEASEEGGSSLDDSAAVRLVLSLCQLADHPGDSIARFHIATSPLARGLAPFANRGLAPFAESSEQKVPVPLSPPLSSPVPLSSPPPLAQSSEQQAPVPLSPLDFTTNSGNAPAGRLARQIRRRLIDDGYGPTVYALARQLAPSCNRRELRRLEKLIGLAYQYDDNATSRPRDFIAYVEAAKVRDPVAADVRVMTVHQAKGLEFDIVVLADLEANLIGQRDDLVVGRPTPTEPIDRVCRRCNSAVQQLLPESWQRLFREADHQDVSESLCVLYVAVTRAVHALHMIVAPSAENEKTLHKTFGGLLRAALTDGNRLAPEQIAYETGDPEWYQNPGVQHELTLGEVAAQAEALAPLQVKLAPPSGHRQRGLERVSPSGLEGGSHVRMTDTWGESSSERTSALQRGTLIHAWFEQILWLDDGPPDEARLRQVANDVLDSAISENELARMLEDFRAMLSNPDVDAVLRRSNYSRFADAELKVENERPIAVRHGDQLMVGNIDRLVTIFENNKPIAADIIDYKTDTVAPGDEEALTSKVDYYRPQIAAYRRAIAKMYFLPPESITAQLLFVSAAESAAV